MDTSEERMALIARSIKHAEESAAHLDKYQEQDLDEELKIRLRTAQHAIRLLGKQLVTAVDPETAYSVKWSEVTEAFISKH